MASLAVGLAWALSAAGVFVVAFFVVAFFVARDGGAGRLSVRLSVWGVVATGGPSRCRVPGVPRGAELPNDLEGTCHLRIPFRPEPVASDGEAATVAAMQPNQLTESFHQIINLFDKLTDAPMSSEARTRRSKVVRETHDAIDAAGQKADEQQ